MRRGAWARAAAVRSHRELFCFARAVRMFEALCVSSAEAVFLGCWARRLRSRVRAMADFCWDARFSARYRLARRVAPAKSKTERVS